METIRIRRGGVFKRIDPKEFGIYQKAGFEKVVTEPVKKLDEDEAVEKPVFEADEEPIKEVGQELDEEAEVIDELPKSKTKNKNKK